MLGPVFPLSTACSGAKNHRTGEVAVPREVAGEVQTYVKSVASIPQCALGTACARTSREEDRRAVSQRVRLWNWSRLAFKGSQEPLPSGKWQGMEGHLFVWGSV